MCLLICLLVFLSSGDSLQFFVYSKEEEKKQDECVTQLAKSNQWFQRIDALYWRRRKWIPIMKRNWWHSVEETLAWPGLAWLGLAWLGMKMNKWRIFAIDTNGNRSVDCICSLAPPPSRRGWQFCANANQNLNENKTNKGSNSSSSKAKMKKRLSFKWNLYNCCIWWW